jgi:hypothetical protein
MNKSSENVQKWRENHSEENKTRNAEYNRKYRKKNKNNEACKLRKKISNMNSRAKKKEQKANAAKVDASEVYPNRNTLKKAVCLFYHLIIVILSFNF